MWQPITLEHAHELIDAKTNRHRGKNKATVCLGVTYPYKRYIWLHREGPNVVVVTLFGFEICRINEDGWTVRTCGHFTPTTRLALMAVLPYDYSITMETPGSRGGEPGEAKGFVTARDSGTFALPAWDALFLPLDAGDAKLWNQPIAA